LAVALDSSKHVVIIKRGSSVFAIHDGYYPVRSHTYASPFNMQPLHHQGKQVGTVYLEFGSLDCLCPLLLSLLNFMYGAYGRMEVRGVEPLKSGPLTYQI
jgi:hypothetical protein